jgi:ABC-2 type transport system permease protein
MRTLLLKELREQWRRRRFLAVAAVLVAFSLFGVLSIKYMPLLLNEVPGVPEGLADVMPEPDIVMALDEFHQEITLFGVILAILVPMGAVVTEKERGTAALILSKPVSRGAFLGAKFIAMMLVFLTGMVLAGLCGYYYLGVLFEWLPPTGFIAFIGLLQLYLTLFLSITLFASTICRSQFAAAGFSFVVWVMLGLLGTFPALSLKLPASMLVWGQALALGLEAVPAWVAVGVTIVIIVGGWLGAWLVLRRQEI